MDIVLALLSVIGLCISAYFSSVFYGVISANSRLVPAFCRMEDGVCQSVIRHPDAMLFGIPNSLIGIVYYTAVLALVLTRLPLLMLVIPIASWVTVVLGVYLTYSLMFKISVVCQLCLTSHFINTVLAVVLTFFY